MQCTMRNHGPTAMLLAFCACGERLASDLDARLDSQPVDARVDANPCHGSAQATPAECVSGGLASIVLDGKWTVTGTTTDIFGDSAPFTTTFYLKQMGTGACAFGKFTSPYDGSMLTAYVDATSANYGYHYVDPHGEHPIDQSWSLCVRPSDGALEYVERYMFVGAFDNKTEAVLTRPPVEE